MRRFYAPPENFRANNIILESVETNHLRSVLRLREGEIVNVFDGAGKEFSCRIETISKKETTLAIIEQTAAPAPESDLHLTLAVAVLKGEKFDLAIQKAVELGVTKLIPLLTKRGDVKIKDEEKKLERRRRIILEASKQCGRAQLMEITAPIDFTNFRQIAFDADETKILFTERGGEKFPGELESKKITAVTGAEGGWEDSELEAARANGFRLVTFGGRILRAETAVIAVAAVLQNRFGDLR